MRSKRQQPQDERPKSNPNPNPNPNHYWKDESAAEEPAGKKEQKTAENKSTNRITAENTTSPDDEKAVVMDEAAPDEAAPEDVTAENTTSPEDEKTAVMDEAVPDEAAPEDVTAEDTTSSDEKTAGMGRWEVGEEIGFEFKSWGDVPPCERGSALTELRQQDFKPLEEALAQAEIKYKNIITRQKETKAIRSQVESLPEDHVQGRTGVIESVEMKEVALEEEMKSLVEAKFKIRDNLAQAQVVWDARERQLRNLNEDDSSLEGIFVVTRFRSGVESPDRRLAVPEWGDRVTSLNGQPADGMSCIEVEEYSADESNRPLQIAFSTSDLNDDAKILEEDASAARIQSIEEAPAPDKKTTMFGGFKNKAIKASKDKVAKLEEEAAAADEEAAAHQEIVEEEEAKVLSMPEGPKKSLKMKALKASKMVAYKKANEAEALRVLQNDAAANAEAEEVEEVEEVEEAEEVEEPMKEEALLAPPTAKKDEVLAARRRSGAPLPGHR